MLPAIAKIVWTGELNVGVGRIDEQHKKLVDTFNKMLAASDAQVGSEIVSETLANLTQYALEHFRDEECLMEEVAYPGIEEHRKEHQQFWKQIAHFCTATSLGDSSVPRELLACVQNWLSHHLLEQDMKYKPFLSASKVR